MAQYTNSRSGVTVGFDPGENGWGLLTNESLARISYNLSGNLVVRQIGWTAPPANPVEGDAYTMGTSPTGVWSTFSEHSIAVYRRISGTWGTLGWVQVTPQAGWFAVNLFDKQIYVYDGAEWTRYAGGGGGGGGISSVFTDTTITGDGTSATPLSVAFPFTQADRDAANTQSDFSETDTSSPAFIKNKPRPTPLERIAFSQTYTPLDAEFTLAANNATYILSDVITVPQEAATLVSTFDYTLGVVTTLVLTATTGIGAVFRLQMIPSNALGVYAQSPLITTEDSIKTSFGYDIKLSHQRSVSAFRLRILATTASATADVKGYISGYTVYPKAVV